MLSKSKVGELNENASKESVLVKKKKRAREDKVNNSVYNCLYNVICISYVTFLIYFIVLLIKEAEASTSKTKKTITICGSSWCCDIKSIGRNDALSVSTVFI